LLPGWGGEKKRLGTLIREGELPYFPDHPGNQYQILSINKFFHS